MTTAQQTAKLSTRRRQREIVFQLNTRIASDYRELVDEVAARENMTIREVVEQAIESRWGRSA